MVSIDPALPQSAIDADFIIQLKTTIIRALRGTLKQRDYPEKKIQQVTISMEYPMTLESYPHIWVEFSLTKLQQAGIGHYFLDDSNNMQGEWIFEGAARFTIMSLSSFERDAYASQFIEMFAFSAYHPAAQRFDALLLESNNFGLAVDRDTLTPGGQMSTVGTPWNPEQVAYQDVYSIRMLGTIQSSFSLPTTQLSDVQVTADGLVGDSYDPSLHISLP